LVSEKKQKIERKTYHAVPAKSPHIRKPLQSQSSPDSSRHLISTVRASVIAAVSLLHDSRCLAVVAGRLAAVAVVAVPLYWMPAVVKAVTVAVEAVVVLAGVDVAVEADAAVVVAEVEVGAKVEAEVSAAVETALKVRAAVEAALEAALEAAVQWRRR
jgi:hypothetical protein